MATDIEQVQTALTEFDRVGAGLAQLTTNFAGMLYEVETPKGMALAKAARQTLRQPRYDIERIRKEAKAPLLAIGKKLDAEAARITAEIMKLEDPIDQQIKNEEDRKERERLAAIEAEAKRVAGIQTRITNIRVLSVMSGATSAELLARHNEVKAMVIGPEFQELGGEAIAARDQTVAILFGLHSAALAAEVEQARVKAEREELVRLRAEQDRRDQEERTRLAEENRRIREQQERERAEQEAALKVERDRLAAERAAQDKAAQAERDKLAAERAEQERVAQIERDRVAAERAEQDRLAQVERDRVAREREQLERDQAALREAQKPKPPAVKRPTDADMVLVLATHYGVESSKVREWLSTFGASKAA